MDTVKNSISVGMMNNMIVDPDTTIAAECLCLLREADRTRPGDTTAGVCMTTSGGFPQIPEGRL